MSTPPLSGVIPIAPTPFDDRDEVDYADLAPGHFDERDEQHVTRRLVHRLEALGYSVQLERSAA